MVGARTARPGAGGAPRDRGFGDAGDQAGVGLLLRLRAGPVHRHRRADGRPLAVAVVLADVDPPSTAGPRTITITVKAMPEGFLSSHLVGGVSAGTVVRLAAPQGNFVMPDPAPASVLFLTAGSGITPVMSMLRTLARRNGIGGPGHVVHVHSAPTESDVMFGVGAGADLANAHDGYRLTATCHAHRGPPRPGPARRRRAGLARSSDLGVRSGGHAQRGREDVVGGRRRRAAAPGDGSPLSRVPVHGQGGTVTFERSGKTVTVDAATLLMDAGERRRGPDAVRLPDGHLSVLRRGAGRRARARSAHRRRTRAGQPGADVYFRSVWRLRAGRITFTGW